MMNRNEIKKYLDGYRINMAKAGRLKDEMENFTASAPSILKEIEECIKQSGMIEGVIISHKNICQREIMLRKYIYGQTLEKIAEELNYSPRHIQRILNDAVDSLGEKIVKS